MNEREQFSDRIIGDPETLRGSDLEPLEVEEVLPPLFGIKGDVQIESNKELESDAIKLMTVSAKMVILNVIEGKGNKEAAKISLTFLCETINNLLKDVK